MDEYAGLNAVTCSLLNNYNIFAIQKNLNSCLNPFPIFAPYFNFRFMLFGIKPSFTKGWSYDQATGNNFIGFIFLC
jgi:hypothetical protein